MSNKSIVQHKLDAIADLTLILKNYIESQSNTPELIPLASHIHSELIDLDTLINEVNYASNN